MYYADVLLMEQLLVPHSFVKGDFFGLNGSEINLKFKSLPMTPKIDFYEIYLILPIPPIYI